MTLNMNMNMDLSSEDLINGLTLRNAIHAYSQERNQEHFIDILVILQNCNVWIPCNMIMGDMDYSYMEHLVNQALQKDDLNSLIGKEFTNKDVIRMVPDILTNDGKYFFPVFSRPDEMGKYGMQFSKVRRHFPDVITMAMNNEKDVSGIVVNAFTMPFILDRRFFEICQNMYSSLK